MYHLKPYKNPIGYFLYALGMLVAVSCKKFVDVTTPKTQLVDASVFNNIPTAKSALYGIYSDMQAGGGFANGGDGSVTVYSAMSADELINYSPSPDYVSISSNSISASNVSLQTAIWGKIYYYIYTCNALIEGLNSQSKIEENPKNETIAEAKFIRAFCYFYLTNLYGDIPLYLTTDYKTNSAAYKTVQAKVYEQIITDLKDAQSVLPSPTIGDTRVLPNGDVVTAFLARVYLFNADYLNAAKQATAIINKTSRYNLLSDLDSVFLMESKEAIWQLKPVIPGLNTNEGSFFILNTTPSSVTLSNYLIDAFDNNDKRKLSWIASLQDNGQTYYYPFKYKIQSGATLSEYSMVIRLAEMYLIRAEASTQLGNTDAALSDINVVRERAGIDDLSVASKDALLFAIDHERQLELFTEWGHRWLDLKRRKKADAILGSEKPGWKPAAALYPIPQVEIAANPHISQNPGY